jgi:hypothetical protein
LDKNCLKKTEVIKMTPLSKIEWMAVTKIVSDGQGRQKKN